MSSIEHLEKIARYVRSLVLCSTSKAGSGHPTSCLSAVEIMTTLFFSNQTGGFHFDWNDKDNPNNDRFILSKGHAAPLLYALWVVSGQLTEAQLMSLRTFDSFLEGHPSVRSPLVEVATGSLGQGLSIGVGMALASRRQGVDNRVFVLLGDGEMEEGQNWEALQIASYYKLTNLVGIIDMSLLEQTGETMLGGDSVIVAEILKKRIEAFGWRAIIIDGHDFDEIKRGLNDLDKKNDKPAMIIARTIKGKGVSFLEGVQGWHGKALKNEELENALSEIGDYSPICAHVLTPIHTKHKIEPKDQAIDLIDLPNYEVGDMVATRKAYGTGLVKAFEKYPNIISLDAGLSNSTFAETFKKYYPDHFYEMFIAEQNMVSVALGMSKRGYVPIVSSFASFLSRSHDQIRMVAHSRGNVKFVGSHSGVSMGEDGPSQMGLEDIAMFRSIKDSVVLYPSDAVSTEKLVMESARYDGIVYIRTTRSDTKVLYDKGEKFPIGGCKILKKTDIDRAVVFACGITLHEALKAHDVLIREGMSICVVDVYSIKPLDKKTVRDLAIEYENIIVVEDHYPEGGLGEAISAVLVGLPIRYTHLTVRKKPRSGMFKELLAYEEIDVNAITDSVKKCAPFSY